MSYVHDCFVPSSLNIPFIKKLIRERAKRLNLEHDEGNVQGIRNQNLDVANVQNDLLFKTILEIDIERVSEN